MKALTHFWGDIMGVEKIGTYSSVNENVDEDIYRLGLICTRTLLYGVVMCLWQALVP